MRILWICLIAAAFSISTAAPTVSAPTPEEEGKSLFETKCNTCHSADRPKKKRKTRKGWEKTVMRMKNRNGCPIDDAQAKTIIDYLAKHYAPEK
jgi:mono/diheme cytochrome c family protein